MQNKIYQRRVKRLSSYNSKIVKVDVGVEQDFKVLNVQKKHSIKLDDHLNMDNTSISHIKPEAKRSENRKNWNPESPQLKKDINPFLEAKCKYMKSKSVKHSQQYDKTFDFDQDSKYVDRKQQLTTYREQRKKDIKVSLSDIKQLQAKISISDALESAASKPY